MFPFDFQYAKFIEMKFKEIYIEFSNIFIGIKNYSDNLSGYIITLNM